MLITTIPATHLSDLCKDFKMGEELREIVGGQLSGTIEKINFGAYVLHKGVFSNLTVAVDALLNLQEQLYLDQAVEEELKALRDGCETEDDYESALFDWADEYRVRSP